MFIIFIGFLILHGTWRLGSLSLLHGTLMVVSPRNPKMEVENPVVPVVMLRGNPAEIPVRSSTMIWSMS